MIENKVSESDTIEEYERAVRAYSDDFAARHGRAPRVFVQTFGCQQNEADSESYIGMAEQMGYELTDTDYDADLIIINTCAIREHAELKALSKTGQFKHLKAKNPELVICICGCMVARESRLLDIKRKYPYVDFLFGATSRRHFPKYLLSALQTGKRAFYEDTDAQVDEGIPVHRSSNFKAWVSIMYGCNNFCTYCIVPYVRGRERSRRKENILSEIEELSRDGYREITLLGQNVNSYGHDIYDDYDFADLLEDICEIKGDFVIRFMTSHPKDASHKLIDTIARRSGDDRMPRIAKQFHLPVQSGSDAVLRAMNRKYTAKDYLSLVGYMKSKIPDISLSTDIIVGFPGETEEDFADTMKIVESVGYDKVFSFIYSKREGTPAAKMDGQIPYEVASERFSRLLKLENDIILKNNEEYLNKTIRVLVEGPSKTDPNMLTGRSEQNRLVHFAGPAELIGNFAMVKIVRADMFSLAGELE